jgi:hypothetical protein
MAVHIHDTQMAFVSYRHFFLDAALLLRGQPQEHLLQTWAGILQQQEVKNGIRSPSTLAGLCCKAKELWSECAGATLVSCCTPDGEVASR